MKSQQQYAVREPYLRAFEEEFYAVWGGTPFQEETENLAYFRSMTCWMDSKHTDLQARRELMYRYLESNFATSAHDDTINELYQIIPVEESVRRVLRNLCLLYNDAPRRIFSAGNYEDLYRQARVNSAMRIAHQTARLTNNALVMPVIRNGKLEIDVFPPDLYRVKTGEKNFRDVVELWIPIVRRGETSFHVWTADQYRKVDRYGREQQAEPNRYGRIPAVILQFEQVPDDYYGGGMYELVSAALDDNKLKFLADNNADYNGFSVWLAVNFGAAADTRIAPNRVLRVDNITSGEGQAIEPDLRTISPNADYLNIEELRDMRYRRALRNMGLPLSLYSSNPGVASGYAMFLERMELMEMRKTDVDAMRAFEQELLDMITVIANADNRAGLPAATVGVDYAEFQITLEPKEDFELKKAKFEFGLIAPLHFVQGLSGNDMLATDEEAIEFLRKNREMLQKLGSNNANAQESEMAGNAGGGTSAGNAGDAAPETEA
jgi:hypothetical protein